MEDFLLCVQVVVKFGNFTLSFGILRQRIVLKCVRARAARLLFLVQPIRSLFLASSLLLPSSLLNREFMQICDVLVSNPVFPYSSFHRRHCGRSLFFKTGS